MPTQELRARTKEGAEVWLSVSTVLIPLRWNDLAVLVHFFRDVGRRKELERGVVALFGRLSSIVDTSTLRSGRTASAPTATTPLTRREQEILRLLASGNSTDTLADTLCISRATVRNHVHSILRKLGVRSRLEAVTLGLRRGLI